MSLISSIEWFEQFLFGPSSSSCLLQPPPVLYKLLARLEADGISWEEIAQKGGLTDFRYQIQGDLDLFLDYIEDDSPRLPTFRTRCMTLFFNHYSSVVARRRALPALPTEDDAATFRAILSGASGPFHYATASFWGDTVRQWFSHRRPLPQTLSSLPSASLPELKQTARLYDLTCTERGERIDPLAMHMIPHAEYLNAVHWQSESCLEAFVTSRPDHPLSRSVKHLVTTSLRQLLNGVHPTCLDRKDPEIDAFCRNIFVVHDSLPEAEEATSPPRVIDVFQRLLALAQLDPLWEKTCQRTPDDDTTMATTDVFLLNEQLHLAERRNQLLLKLIPPDA